MKEAFARAWVKKSEREKQLKKNTSQSKTLPWQTFLKFENYFRVKWVSLKKWKISNLLKYQHSEWCNASLMHYMYTLLIPVFKITHDACYSYGYRSAVLRAERRINYTRARRKSLQFLSITYYITHYTITRPTGLYRFLFLTAVANIVFLSQLYICTLLGAKKTKYPHL